MRLPNTAGTLAGVVAGTDSLEGHAAGTDSLEGHTELVAAVPASATHCGLAVVAATAVAAVGEAVVHVATSVGFPVAAVAVAVAASKLLVCLRQIFLSPCSLS